MEAVGDHNHGAVLGGGVNCLPHKLFAFGVAGAGGFVEDQDGGRQRWRGRSEGAVLAAGEVGALGLQHLVMLAKLEDEIFRVGDLAAAQSLVAKLLQ